MSTFMMQSCSKAIYPMALTFGVRCIRKLFGTWIFRSQFCAFYQPFCNVILVCFSFCISATVQHLVSWINIKQASATDYGFIANSHVRVY